MISKGTTHDNGGKLAVYMVTGKEGEHAELWQLRGFASDDIKDAFRSIHVMAEATRCEKPLFHVQVRNPDGERLTREQWERVADRIESKLGLTDQPRAIAFHQELATDGEHMHIGWSRIDGDTMTAKALPFFKLRLKEVSRELEAELGLTPVRNEREDPVMAPKRDEDEQARRLGVDIRAIRTTIRECWERSDNGKSFAAALGNEGIILAKGDERDFIAIDHEGGIHALGKRILGNTAKEIRARTADLDRDELPSVETAREQMAARREAATEQTATHAVNRAWEVAIADAAKENTKRKSPDPEAATPTAAKPETQIDESATEIRDAYGSATNAAEFIAELDRSGIRLAAVTPADAEQCGRYRPGEIVAISQTGQIHQLDEATIGRSRAAIEEFLAPLDRGELHGIEVTQEQIHLEASRHLQLTEVGLLRRQEIEPTSDTTSLPYGNIAPQIPKGAVREEPLVDWERMLTDIAYRRQVENRDRERRASERQQGDHFRPRGREPDR